MEKILIIIFLTLFAARFCWWYFLQQLNISYLWKHCKEIPLVFQGIIDKNTLNKIIDYTVDNTRLSMTKYFIFDAVELAVIFFFASTRYSNHVS
jgi:hypothetical protein